MSLDELRALNKPSAEELVEGEDGGNKKGGSTNGNAKLRKTESLGRILEEKSVLVTVRSRPLNARELSIGAKACMDCSNPTDIQVQNGPSAKGDRRESMKEKLFHYDATFDDDRSCDNKPEQRCANASYCAGFCHEQHGT